MSGRLYKESKLRRPASHRYQQLYRLMQYTFQQPSLLTQALTRRSAINEGLSQLKAPQQKRLAFIGDGVLELIIRGRLFSAYPDANTGYLTIEKAKLVSNQGPLAQVAKRLGIPKLLVVGRGEEYIRIRQDTKALSDAMEAVIGAMWLDSGHNFPVLQTFILRQWTFVSLLPEPSHLFSDIQNLLWGLSESNSLTDDLSQQLVQKFNQGISAATLGELLKECLDYPALMPILLKQHPRQEDMNKALILSIVSNHTVDVVRRLLAHRADPNASGRDDRFDGTEYENPYHDKTSSALQLAVADNLMDHVRLLLECKADVNWNQGVTTKTKITGAVLRGWMREAVSDTMGVTLPEFAYGGRCYNWNGQGGYSVINPPVHRARRAKRTVNEETALHYAVLIENPLPMLVLLLHAKANPNAQDQGGQSALHVLYHTDNFKDKAAITVMLLQAGFNPHLTDEMGNTVLHVLFGDRMRQVTYKLEGVFFWWDYFKATYACVIALLKAGARWNSPNQKDISARKYAEQLEFFEYHQYWLTQNVLEQSLGSPIKELLASQVDSFMQAYWMKPEHATWQLWLLLKSALCHHHYPVSIVAACCDDAALSVDEHQKGIEYGLLFFQSCNESKTEAKNNKSPSLYT